MTTAHNKYEDQQGLWESREAAEAWRRNAATRMQILGTATERMLVLANINEGCHVLDIAAGTGDQTILAAQRVGPHGQVVAIDISPEMLAIAAEQARQAGLTNVTTQVMDAQHLDFPAETFDAVIARQGLMFIPNVLQALTRMWHVLKPGGTLAATVWSTPERNPVFTSGAIRIGAALVMSLPMTSAAPVCPVAPVYAQASINGPWHGRHDPKPALRTNDGAP